MQFVCKVISMDALLHSRFQKYYISLVLGYFLCSLSGIGESQEPAPEFFQRGQWVANGPVGGTIAVLRIHPAEANILFAGTDDGQLYRSDNQGDRWIRITPGLKTPGIRVSCLEFYPANPDIMYAGTTGIWNDGGLYRSLDRGETWTQIPGRIGKLSVHALQFVPGTPSLVYAGTEDGVYKSFDGGSSWKHISEGFQHQYVKSLAVHPENSQIVYAGTWRQVYKSHDGGITWKHIPTGMDRDTDIFALQIDPKSPSVLYAATCNGIFKTTNGGGRWRKVAERQGLRTVRVQALLVSRHVPGRLYAGTIGGIYVSQNHGASWTELTQTSIVVSSLQEDHSNQDVLYAGIEGGRHIKKSQSGPKLAAKIGRNREYPCQSPRRES